ncbi:TAF4 [Candida theae]|uniref:Transcription initiation factor TFIID subunit 4 n=1 Tax=Candida theae TaxID=1198502 RepID=A0AAD5BG74_9ASCO|nr:TAF4 [Candida theae]KAI5960912.1 TAF4 [Candida theae]
MSETQDTDSQKRSLPDPADLSSPSKRAKTGDALSTEGGAKETNLASKVEHTKTLTNTSNTTSSQPANTDTTATAREGASAGKGSNTNDKTKSDQQDSSRLNDAIAAAGVNLHEEEELLLQQQLARKNEAMNEGNANLQSPKVSTFLNPYHLAAFLGKVAKKHQVNQSFLEDGDVLNLISGACETWISHIAAKTITISRHRRRGGVLTTSKKNGASSSSSSQRSAVSRELRNLAVKQKELEEKRVNKRIALGIEKSANDPSDEGNGDGKAGADETLHRAANATAAMMTVGKKKYSWMNSGAGGGGAGADNDGKDNKGSSRGKQSPIIAARGDSGLRYREVRAGNSIVLKDLLGAIEHEKRGTQEAIIKGYAKLRD